MFLIVTKRGKRVILFMRIEKGFLSEDYLHVGILVIKTVALPFFNISWRTRRYSILATFISPTKSNFLVL